MDSKLKDRLQKLRNLAERGVGGEKETAERKLSQLLSQNGLTESDLTDDSVRYYLFSYTYPYRKALLGQIIYKVLGANNSAIYKTKGTRNRIGAYCTASQKVEIELDFEFYSNLLEEEIKVLMSAFIKKQDIFPEDVPVSVVHQEDLSPEEMDRYRKINMYANQIDKRTRSLMIEDKNPEA